MAKGRMLNNKISLNKVVNQLSDRSQLAYTWAIAHLDKNGVMHGDPAVFRSIVFPRRADISSEEIQDYIAEWAKKELVIWYESHDDIWIQFPKFLENQVGLRPDREPETGYPLPSADDCRMLSGYLPEDCRQTSGNVPENIPPNRTEQNRTKQNRILVPDRAKPEPDPERVDDKNLKYLPLAEKLADHIQANDPGHFKNKNRKRLTSSWADDFRLLLERDGRDQDLVVHVLDWCQNDSFWKTNILSGSKFRKQFPQLLLKMKSQGPSPGKNGDDPTVEELDRVARRIYGIDKQEEDIEF